MSSVVKLMSLMHDTDCLVDALEKNKETVILTGTTITVTSQNYYRETIFVKTETGYQLLSDSDNKVVNNSEWLKNINLTYNDLYALKLEKLAEKERVRLEVEQKKYVEAQEEMIKAKAKKLGYKIEKRVKSDKKIQLVFVKRNL